MKKKQKYEAQIAKSTLPKGFTHRNLTIGKWYPIIKLRGARTDHFGRNFDIVFDDGEPHYCLEKGCVHLQGGNFKIRKVKNVQSKG